jgi:hypothetical protein
MTDYASCPVCHGEGLVPLEVAQTIETAVRDGIAVLDEALARSQP